MRLMHTLARGTLVPFDDACGAVPLPNATFQGDVGSSRHDLPGGMAYVHDGEVVGLR